MGVTFTDICSIDLVKEQVGLAPSPCLLCCNVKYKTLSSVHEMESFEVFVAYACRFLVATNKII